MANKVKLAEFAVKARAEADEALENANAAIKAKDLPAYNEAMNDLTEKVKTVNEFLCKIDYEGFLEQENPMIAAVKAFYIKTLRVKENRDKETDALVDVTLEERNTAINLERFCKHGDLDMTWAHDSNKLLELLALRETDVFKMTPAQLATKSHYFIANARAKKEGETPDSNTKIVKMLQKIIDEAIFVDNGKGENVYKCTNHDIAFIQDASTKIDTRAKCGIAMLSQSQFKRVMTSVFAHCLGEKYTVKVAKPPKA